MGTVQQLINTDAYDIHTFLLVLVCVLFAFVEITKLIKYLKDYTGYKSKREQRLDEDEEKMADMQAQITAINDKIAESDARREETLHKLNESIDILIEGEMNVLSDLIERRCSDYKDRGYLSVQDSSQLESMGASYKRLHGNHGIDTLIEHTQKLPILTDDEIAERKVSQ